MRGRFFFLCLILSLGISMAWAGGAAASDRAQGKPGQPIVISWSTETEVNTAGFNVYRALSEDGPWEKINDRLIPGSPDPLRGGNYTFTDSKVQAGVSYWYELEEVELSGQTTRLERTMATARGAGLLDGLQCTGGLSALTLFSLGLVWTQRRKATYGS